tara:strand:- start:3525 stop:3767 length:243 start_codon:yes stop_codon:yes gene_type:complete
MKRADVKYDLLKQFLHFLRDEDYTLLGNSVFRDSSKWVKTPPRPGDKVSINIHFEGKVPSDRREDVLINTFLQEFRDKGV